MKPLLGVLVMIFQYSIVMNCQEFDYHLQDIDYYLSDLSIVNIIHQKTDITEADVKKYKLLFLGNTDYYVASGLSLYGTYQAAHLVQSIPYSSLFSSVLPEVKEYIPALFSKKLLWASAAAGATGLLLFPQLYYRTQQGIWDKIEAFDNYCLTQLDAGDPDRFTIATYICREADKLQQLIPKNWITDGLIAQCAGFDDLIKQCRYAKSLLRTMDTPTVTKNEKEKINNWIDKLTTYYTTLMANRKWLIQDLNSALDKRQLLINTKRKNKLADLEISKAYVGISVMYINNITKVWKLLKDTLYRGK